MSNDFCNPIKIEDYYTPPPAPVLKPPVTPDPPVPPHDGPLQDPEAPGNLVAEAIGEFLDPVKLVERTAQTLAASGASALAATVNAVETALPIAEDVARRANAAKSIASELDKITQAKLFNFADDANAAMNALQNLATIVGLNQWSPESIQAINNLRSNYVAPLVGWVNRVDSLTDNALMNGGIAQIDLSDADGSLTDYVNVIGGVCSAIGLIPSPWQTTGQTMAVWAQAGLSAWKGVLQMEKGAEDMVKAAEDLLAAAQTTLLAACEALPALTMMLKNVFDSIWAFGKFNFLNIKLPLIPDVHFKLPSIPAWDRLAKWPGVASNLSDSVSKTMAKCMGSWQTEKVLDAASGRTIEVFKAPNMNALTDGLSGLRDASQAFQLGKQGVGRTTNGVATSTEVTRAAWETTKTLLGIAPPPVHVLPEDAGVLGQLAGGVPASAVDPSEAPVGASKVDASTLQDTAANSDVPVVPGPAQQIFNMTQIARELNGHVQMSQAIGQMMIDLASHAKTLGETPEEMDARLALVKAIESFQLQLAMVNLALDGSLNPQSLSPAAKAYYYCLAYERSQGNAAPPSDGASMIQAGQGAMAPPAGAPNSVVDQANSNNPDGAAGSGGSNGQGSAGDLINDLSGSAVPSDWFSESQKNQVKRFEDPEDSIDLTTAPYAYVCRTASDRALFESLKDLDQLITDIRSNPKLYQSHLSVREKAQLQGLGSNSPYSWLGDGLAVLSGYQNKDGSYMTLLEIVARFLVHDSLDIRPVMNWLKALNAIDSSVPVPMLDNFRVELYNETYAATQSADYTSAHAADDFEGIVFGLRQNADLLGGPLAFEYALLIGILALSNRMKKLALKPDSTPEQVQAVAKIARDMAELVYHKDLIVDLLDALQPEE